MRTSTIAITDRGPVPEQIELAGRRSSNADSNRHRGRKLRQEDTTENDSNKSTDGTQFAARSAQSSAQAESNNALGTLTTGPKTASRQEVGIRLRESAGDAIAAEPHSSGKRHANVPQTERQNQKKRAHQAPSALTKIRRRANATKSTAAVTAGPLDTFFRPAGPNKIPFSFRTLLDRFRQPSVQTGPSNGASTLIAQRGAASEKKTRIRSQQSAGNGRPIARLLRLKSHSGKKRKTLGKPLNTRTARQLYRSHEEAGTNEISSHFQSNRILGQSKTRTQSATGRVRQAQEGANREVQATNVIIDVDAMTPSSLSEAGGQNYKPRSTHMDAPANLIIPEVPESSIDASCTGRYNTNRQGQTRTISRVASAPIDVDAFPSQPSSPAAETRGIAVRSGSANSGWVAPQTTAVRVAPASKDKTATRRLGHEHPISQNRRDEVSKRPNRPPKSWPRDVAFAPNECPPSKRRQLTLNEVITTREPSPDRVQLLPTNQTSVQKRRQTAIEEVMTVGPSSTDRVRLRQPSQNLDLPEPQLRQTTFNEILVNRELATPAVRSTSSLNSKDARQGGPVRNRSRERERHLTR